MVETDRINKNRKTSIAPDNIEWSCPIHFLPLATRDGALVCPEGDFFPVRNRIPRFVPPNTYADSFGARWNKYQLTQLDSHSGTTITRDRTRRCLGEELWENLAGKRVLECGCGAGRFTEILLERGARVTSFDLSEAVDANQRLKDFDEVILNSFERKLAA